VEVVKIGLEVVGVALAGAGAEAGGEGVAEADEEGAWVGSAVAGCWLLVVGWRIGGGGCRGDGADIGRGVGVASRCGAGQTR